MRAWCWTLARPQFETTTCQIVSTPLLASVNIARHYPPLLLQEIEEQAEDKPQVGNDSAFAASTSPEDGGRDTASWPHRMQQRLSLWWLTGMPSRQVTSDRSLKAFLQAACMVLGI